MFMLCTLLAECTTRTSIIAAAMIISFGSRYPRALWLARRYMSTSNAQPKPIVESNDYEPVIGLEVHAQLRTNSKLFSAASTRFQERPNSQVAYFDQSLPGTLPVLNRRAVELAVISALALECRLPTWTRFDRKHYFYGDMPNGYQITQQFEPIAQNGHLDFIVFDEYKPISSQAYLKRCRLKQIQIEQDSGKSLVDEGETGKQKQSLIDLNRTGVPLLEFVFEPDLNSALEAVSLVKTLVQVLEATGVCSCRMEEGALRVDANISIRPVGSDQLGTRTEVKNLNSFRFIYDAIEYELQRQRQLVATGQRVINETMAFDFRSKSTIVMRDKEIVQDYRFMPEPNLPAMKLIDRADEGHQANADRNVINIAPFREQLARVELPRTVRQRLLDLHGLSLAVIYRLMSDQDMFNLFQALYNASRLKNSLAIFEYIEKQLLPILLGEEVSRAWHKRLLDVTMAQLLEKISAHHLSEIIDLQHEGRISLGTSLDLVQLYVQGETRPPADVIDAHEWWLLTDQSQIEAACRQVIAEHPKIARKFAKTGVRRPQSMLIQRACALLNNQVDEPTLWDNFERLLKDK